MDRKKWLFAALLSFSGVLLGTDASGQIVRGSPVQLTFDPATDYYPTWSPDGRWIAFGSGREGSEAIWKVLAEGGIPTRLTQGPDTHPCWSPEGSFIVFDADGTDVRVIGPDGGVPVKVNPDSLSLPEHSFPTWSHDGRAVFLSGHQEVLSIDLASGDVARIYRREGSLVRAFKFSPDGKYLVAAVYPSANQPESDLWLIPLDGSEPVQITDLPGRVDQPDYSPDGTMIAFQWTQEGKSSLHAVSSAGGDPVRITDDDYSTGSPRWSPDGERIAFVSNRDGNTDVWVMELDIGFLRRLLEAG
jgi:TolB protein